MSREIFCIELHEKQDKGPELKTHVFVTHIVEMRPLEKGTELTLTTRKLEVSESVDTIKKKGEAYGVIRPL